MAARIQAGRAERARATSSWASPGSQQLRIGHRNEPVHLGDDFAAALQHARQIGKPLRHDGALMAMQS